MNGLEENEGFVGPSGRQHEGKARKTGQSSVYSDNLLGGGGGGGGVWATLQSKGNELWKLDLEMKRRAVYTIGRHPSCTLVLADMHISSKHLTITVKQQQDGTREAIIEDSSSNGTWLNGDKLTRGKSVQLEDGAEISLPCDEDQKKQYTFVFTRYDDDDDCMDETSGSRYGALIGTDDDDEWNATGNDQWEELARLQEELSTQAARLAASVYTNSETMESLLDLTVYNTPVSRLNPNVLHRLELDRTLVIDEDEDEERKETGIAEQGMKALYAANDNIKTIARNMLDSMRSTMEIISVCDELSTEHKTQLVQTLNIKQWEKTLAHLFQDDTNAETTRSSSSSSLADATATVTTDHEINVER